MALPTPITTMDPSSSSRPRFLERISSLLSHEPEDRDELIDLLRSAYDRSLFDADALAIIEGALQVSEIQVRDVMIPRALMNVVSVDDPIEKIAAFAVETAHSRFPVIGEGRDDVVGVLLAKDLLRYFAGKEFVLRDVMRPAIFIPETKRLNVLLREFRANRNHMALVVDEYGGVAGLVTIEDVLEQIVGDIEDEYDFDADAGNIVADPAGRYRVKATTAIDAFNEAFGVDWSDPDYDTLGGLLMSRLGRLPQRDEVIEHDGLRLQVLRADTRRVHSLLVERLAEAAEKT